MARAGDLNRARIVAEALELLDSGGITALSMRGLAARLGVKAASLYHHFDGQDDLIDAIQDEVNAEIDLTPLADLSRDGLAAFARSYRDAFARHPNVVDLVSRRPTTAPRALTLYDALAGHLLGRGLAPELLLPMLAVLDFVVLGSAADSLADDLDGVRSRADSYPSLALGLGALGPAAAGDRAFEIGLEHCLTVIEGQLPVLSGNQARPAR